MSGMTRVGGQPRGRQLRGARDERPATLSALTWLLLRAAKPSPHRHSSFLSSPSLLISMPSRRFLSSYVASVSCSQGANSICNA